MTTLIRRPGQLRRQRSSTGQVWLPSGSGTSVARHGDLVRKTHTVDTDYAELAQRLAVAAAPALAGIFLPPCSAQPQRRHRRLTSEWPAARPVCTEPRLAPWTEAARLLARLHSVPLAPLGPLPAAGGPSRIARTVHRMRELLPDDATAAAVYQAWRRLPEGSGRTALTHGDWHLGQLVEYGQPARWLLIDVDDLGIGDPVLDLGRPAALYAVGLLPASVWWEFVADYQAAGGPAAPETDGPWAVFDGAARAYTVHAAAGHLVRARRDGRPIDEAGQQFLAACERMADEAP